MRSLSKLQKQTDNEINYVFTLHQLSRVYYRNGNLEKVIFYNKLAYDIVSKLGKDKKLEYMGIWETKALYANRIV